MSKCFLVAGLVALVAVCAPRAPAQQVHVVAPEGTPGGEFLGVQAAIDAAADGDVVLVLPGSYPGDVFVHDQQLVLAGVVGPSGERAQINSLTISGVAADRSVVVRGLGFASLFTNESLAVVQCAGPVHVEDCSVEINLALQPPRVVDSERVVLARCTLRGPQGTLIIPASATPGGAGLSVTRSTVSLYDCDIAGGAGASGSLVVVLAPSSVGGPGVVVSDGTLLVAGSSVRGGQGGAGFAGPLCVPPSSGGDGLVLDGLLRLLDSTLEAGLPGDPQGCSSAASAGTEFVLLGGSVTTIPQTLRRLAITSPIEEGGTCAIAIQAQPFEPVLLLQSLEPLGSWLGGLKGTLAGAPPYVVYALGFSGADGALAFDIAIPAGLLPAGIEAAVFVDQIVTAAAGGGGLLGSPSSVVLVQDLP